MEVNLTSEEFKSKYLKLKVALVSGKDVSNYLVDDDNESVQINLGKDGYILELHSNGTWEIL